MLLKDVLTQLEDSIEASRTATFPISLLLFLKLHYHLSYKLLTYYEYQRSRLLLLLIFEFGYRYWKHSESQLEVLRIFDLSFLNRIHVKAARSLSWADYLH